MKKTFSYFFLLAKEGLSNHDIKVARGTVFEEIRPGVGFKTGNFVKEELRRLPSQNDSEVR